MWTGMSRVMVLFTLALGCALAQPADFADAVREGNRLMSAGRYAEAAAKYEAIVKAKPNDPGVRVNLGMAYHLAGRDRDAVTQLEAALKQQPDIVPAMVMVSASYLRLGQPDRALPHLRRAVAAAPDMPEAREMLAESLAAAGRPEDAVEHFRRSAALDPKNPKVWHGLGLAYQELAQQAAEQLAKTAPESGYTIAAAAANQAARGRLRSAFHLYKEALKREPGVPGARDAIAEIYRMTGHPDWAGKVPENPSSAAPAGKEASLYNRVRGDLKAAADAFAKLDSLPPSVEQHAWKASLLRERGLYADAAREWKAALALAPGHPAIEKDLAITLRLNQDYAGARTILERLLNHDPRSPELNYLMGQVLVNLQQPDAALPFLQAAVKARPSFLPARSSLGLALIQGNRDAEAIPHLKAALPLDTDGTLHFRLARAYQKLGQSEQAKPLLAKYREMQSAGTGKAEGEITPP